MKYSLFALSLFILLFDSTSLDISKKNPSAFSLFDCNTTQNLTGCNYIRNNTFTPHASYNPNNPIHVDDPFNLQLIPEWQASFGSPQIVNFGLPPVSSPISGSGFVSMSSGGPTITNGPSSGEGIAQQIPKLTTGAKYAFSFFKRFQQLSSYITDLDKFYVVLLHCSDYNSEVASNMNDIPPIPNNSQVIFCQNDFANPNWEQNRICFTATSDFDIIWIFPKNITENPDRLIHLAGLNLAYPELIQINNFSAGSTPNPIYPNCNVTIGPTTPNCGPVGASFFWTSPSGQTYPVTAGNQQLSVNASTDFGTWTLNMTIPDQATNDYLCGTKCQIKSTVNVPQCLPCASTILPAGPITFYNMFEQPNSLVLTCSPAPSYQWYKNNVAIPGATNQTYTINFIGSNDYTDYYSVVTSCGTSNTVTFNYIGCVYENEYPVDLPGNNGFFCQSSLPITVYAPGLGAGTTYSWATTGSISLSNCTGNQCQLNSSIQYPAGSIYSISRNNGQEIHVFYMVAGNNPACRTMNTVSNSIDYRVQGDFHNRAILYPNPAKSFFTVNSVSPIDKIEIYNAKGILMGHQQGGSTTNTITVNIEKLQSGIYFCKVFRRQEYEIMKLVVKK